MGEEQLRDAVDVLVRLVEAARAVIIFGGAVMGFGRFLWAAVRYRSPERFVPVRLDLGRVLALGLEVQTRQRHPAHGGGSVLRGDRAARRGSSIRTALNFFLSREIAEEREELASGDN